MGNVNHPKIDVASVAQGAQAMTAGTDYERIRGYCVDTDGEYTFVFSDDTEATLYRVRGIDYGGMVKQVKTSPAPAGSVIGFV